MRPYPSFVDTQSDGKAQDTALVLVLWCAGPGSAVLRAVSSSGLREWWSCCSTPTGFGGLRLVCRNQSCHSPATCQKPSGKVGTAG